MAKTRKKGSSSLGNEKTLARIKKLNLKRGDLVLITRTTNFTPLEEGTQIPLFYAGYRTPKKTGEVTIYCIRNSYQLRHTDLRRVDRYGGYTGGSFPVEPFKSSSISKIEKLVIEEH